MKLDFKCGHNKNCFSKLIEMKGMFGALVNLT